MRIKGLKLLSTFKSVTPQETIDFACSFSKNLKRGDLLLLVGDYGVGKTTFLNGVLRYLGSKDRVISSSFVKISSYRAEKINLVHCDFYRSSYDELMFEILEYLQQGNIVAIEWPGEIKNFLRFHPYVIKIHLIDENKRFIKVYKHG